MDVRQSIHSDHAKTLDTAGLRREFLIETIFVADEYTMTYSHIDRIIVGGVMPVNRTVAVGSEVGKQLGVSYFLERRELGVINIGGPGLITVDGTRYEMNSRDGLYVGKGAKEVVFESADAANPARFYYNCAPAHTTFPTKRVTPADVSPVHLGEDVTSNRRTINKYFIPDVLETCQLSMGLTELAPGWLRRPLGIAIELLAAIPSIVYGMWGLFIFAPLFATYFQEPVGNVLSAVPFVGALFSGPAFGIGILAAGVILAIMIIPYIAAVMRDVFEQTPVMMKESAYGIGCTTWEVIWRIVLPFTKNGVIGGIMLGLGRALGETMAVTFIIGNTYQLDSVSLYMPGNSITSALANEFAEAESGLHVAALMELGLILFVITFIVLAISKLMIMRLAKNEGAR